MEDVRSLGESVAWLKRATELDSSNIAAGWGLGRVALAAGDAATAVTSFNNIKESSRRYNSLFRFDQIVAYSHAGDDREVGELIDGLVLPITEFRLIQPVVDAIFLHNTFLRNDHPDNTAAAYQLRPADLFINYQLWKQANQSGDSYHANQYFQTLEKFPAAALIAGDERVVDLAASVIPSIYSDKIWSETLTAGVVADLVWQYPIPSVEKMLRDLNRQYPNERDWAWYLAEIYVRRGAWQQAQDVYESMLKKDPADAAVILRLGVVTEDSGNIGQAATLLEKYRTLKPDDVFGLQQLSDIYHQLGRPESSSIDADLQQNLNTRQTIANLLNRQIDQIDLGPDLLAQRDMSLTSFGLKGWRLADYATGEITLTPHAAIMVGPDQFLAPGTDATIKLAGIWMDPPEAGHFYGVVTNDGVLHTSMVIDTLPDRMYVISGLYRTASSAEQVSVYVGNPQMTVIDRHLNSTNGEWRSFIAAGCQTGAGSEKVQVLLRASAPGQVWFQQVRVQPFAMQNLSSNCSVDALSIQK